MTDQALLRQYASWSDEELLSARDACLATAELQVRWGVHKMAKQCRDRAALYTKALASRGIR